jgi:hypothetical protein
MSVPEARQDWTDANQRLLVAEFARIKALLAGEKGTAVEAQLKRCRAALAAPAAIDRLVERFALSVFERELVLLTAGVEMDAEVSACCAAASGEAHRRWASFALALAVLSEPHWSALTPSRPLRRWRLLEASEDAPLVSAKLRIDERVLHFLAGVNYLDTRLQPLVRRLPKPGVMSEAQRNIAETIAVALEKMDPPLPIVQLSGGDPHGKRDVAASIAARCGLQLYAIAGEDIPANPHEMEALAALWERETALLDAALLVECADAAPGPAVRRFVERIEGLTLLALPEAMTFLRGERRYPVDRPDRRDQLLVWQQVLGNSSAAHLGRTLEGLASEFKLSAQDIRRVGGEFDHAAPVSEAEVGLWKACRSLQRLRLDRLAQRIEPGSGWDDLVLAEPQKSTLLEIAAHVRHRFTVDERWGFAAKSARGLGISVLFAGESGTGKTMAAEVLANELHLELYRIDLSAVVSKYIGETEKNLARVFDVAQDSGAILLFDEADALFGKRSEVKDSHDRYANIEVSYLLQRMETYRGLAILTTNQKAALDTAFQRRLRFVLHFPFPDAAEREAIWRRVFPAATPTNGLAYAKLARLHMSGGNIRNIALNAAFYAAEAAGPVGMAHLLKAAHAEAAKRERPLTEAETRGWV